MLFKMENMKGQSLVNKCDLIEFDATSQVQ